MRSSNARVPPETDEELQLRRHLVFEALKRSTAEVLAPRLEFHHLDRDLLSLRPRAPDVVDVDRGRDRELPRRARHVGDYVDEEDLEHPRHAPRAKVAVDVTGSDPNS